MYIVLIIFVCKAYNNSLIIRSGERDLLWTHSTKETKL